MSIVNDLGIKVVIKIDNKEYEMKSNFKRLEYVPPSTRLERTMYRADFSTDRGFVTLDPNLTDGTSYKLEKDDIDFITTNLRTEEQFTIKLTDENRHYNFYSAVMTTLQILEEGYFQFDILNTPIIE